MSPIEIIAMVAMTAYAVYKQTITSEVSAHRRFTMAILYTVIGVAVGGFTLPAGALGWGLLIFSLALSAVVGVIRGRKTNVWMRADGRAVRQGNAATITLFLGLIVAKFALGTLAYLAHISDGAGFGEIMVMIAIMIAVQAEIVYRRSQSLPTTLHRVAQAA